MAFIFLIYPYLQTSLHPFTWSLHMGFTFCICPCPFCIWFEKWTANVAGFYFCIWFRIELLPFACCPLPITCCYYFYSIKNKNPRLRSSTLVFILTFACAFNSLLLPRPTHKQGKQAFLLVVVCILVLLQIRTSTCNRGSLVFSVRVILLIWGEIRTKGQEGKQMFLVFCLF